MSLDYNLTRVPDWKKIPWGTINTIIFSTMFIGMGDITEQNYKQFFSRISAWEKLHGNLRVKVTKGNRRREIPFTLAEIKALIGLHTNVSYMTPAKFKAQLLNRMEF